MDAIVEAASPGESALLPKRSGNGIVAGLRQVQIERRTDRVRAFPRRSCREASGLSWALAAVRATDALKARVQALLLRRVAPCAGHGRFDPMNRQHAQEIACVRDHARIE